MHARQLPELLLPWTAGVRGYLQNDEVLAGVDAASHAVNLPEANDADEGLNPVGPLGAGTG